MRRRKGRRKKKKRKEGKRSRGVCHCIFCWINLLCFQCFIEVFEADGGVSTLLVVLIFTGSHRKNLRTSFLNVFDNRSLAYAQDQRAGQAIRICRQQADYMILP